MMIPEIPPGIRFAEYSVIRNGEMKGNPSERLDALRQTSLEYQSHVLEFLFNPRNLGISAENEIMNRENAAEFLQNVNLSGIDTRFPHTLSTVLTTTLIALSTGIEPIQAVEIDYVIGMLLLPIGNTRVFLMLHAQEEEITAIQSLMTRVITRCNQPIPENIVSDLGNALRRANNLLSNPARRSQPIVVESAEPESALSQRTLDDLDLIAKGLKHFESLGRRWELKQVSSQDLADITNIPRTRIKNLMGRYRHLVNFPMIDPHASRPTPLNPATIHDLELIANAIEQLVAQGKRWEQKEFTRADIAQLTGLDIDRTVWLLDVYGHEVGLSTQDPTTISPDTRRKLDLLVAARERFEIDEHKLWAQGDISYADLASQTGLSADEIRSLLDRHRDTIGFERLPTGIRQRKQQEERAGPVLALHAAEPNLSQKVIAERLGISEAAVQRILKNAQAKK